ncbi:capsular biosynthesis protein [Roseibium sp. CAU 1637]|uniref:Capsular biosynthesis protein n=1 Tax=Roseibium limicola TaxID=2816037 RepID=A0A939J5Q9_9HYPH|nr:capsular biosynthesis protein [Roseibium limicola]
MGQAFRVFLFLQGPPARFARVLADELDLLGAKSLRVNLCAGDWLAWHDLRCTNYRGSLSDWKAWLSDFCLANGVTDIVYYADRLPYHVAAHEVAQDLGIECFAYEFGYLRPDWITLERNGMSAHSLFPNNAETIRTAARDLPDIDRRQLYGHSFGEEAFVEVIHNMSNVVLASAFPKYDRDRCYHPLADYTRHLFRLPLARWRNRRAGKVIDDLVASGTPYYVFPLQLQSDYQLRFNSPFNHIGKAAEEVIRSFAKSAPVEAHLVFKVHPLDNGIEPWTRILMSVAKRFGVKRRVRIIDGGNLDELLRYSRGALTINSTTGLHSLRVGCPTKVLGIALYDMEGLTCQVPIDDFWKNGTVPDLELLDSLERLLAATIQVKGDFYQPKGQRVAAYAMARRLMENRVNEPGALCEEPPRLARAKAMNIPVTFVEQMANRGKTERWFNAWRR